MGLNVVFGAIFPEFVTIELEGVVHDKSMQHPKPGGDVLMNEHLYVPLSDGGKSLSLGPFCEVVHCNNDISALSLGGW